MITGSVAAISHSLQLRLSSIYLFAVSILGIATFTGARKGGPGSPLLELGNWWSSLTSQPATWTDNVQVWLSDHSGSLFWVPWLIIVVAALSLAKLGWQSVDTRTGPTLVLGLSLGSSTSGHSAWLFWAVAFGLVIFGRLLRHIALPDDFIDGNDVGGVIISVGMAFAYAPFLILQWMTGKARSEHSALKYRQVAALEKIALHDPDPDIASGAKPVRSANQYL